MTEPKNYQDYLVRTKENTKITGFGLGNVHTEFPCPFCAAPNWMKCELMETEKTMQNEHTCIECGRSAKAIFHRNDSSCTSFEMVQTGGTDQPEYFTVKMRRVE